MGGYALGHFDGAIEMARLKLQFAQGEQLLRPARNFLVYFRAQGMVGFNLVRQGDSRQYIFNGPPRSIGLPAENSLACWGQGPIGTLTLGNTRQAHQLCQSVDAQPTC